MGVPDCFDSPGASIHDVAGGPWADVAASETAVVALHADGRLYAVDADAGTAQVIEDDLPAEAVILRVLGCVNHFAVQVCDLSAPGRRPPDPQHRRIKRAAEKLQAKKQTLETKKQCALQ